MVFLITFLRRHIILQHIQLGIMPRDERLLLILPVHGFNRHLLLAENLHLMVSTFDVFQINFAMLQGGAAVFDIRNFIIICVCSEFDLADQNIAGRRSAWIIFLINLHLFIELAVDRFLYFWLLNFELARFSLLRRLSLDFLVRLRFLILDRFNGRHVRNFDPASVRTFGVQAKHIGNELIVAHRPVDAILGVVQLRLKVILRLCLLHFLFLV